MDNLKLYIVWLCFVLSSAELLGPEDRKKAEDDDGSLEEIKEDRDREYYNEISEAMSKELRQMREVREYAEAIQKTAGLLKGEEEENKGLVPLFLFY